jgi:hypothetical protein
VGAVFFIDNAALGDDLKDSYGKCEIVLAFSGKKSILAKFRKERFFPKEVISIFKIHKIRQARGDEGSHAVLLDERGELELPCFKAKQIFGLTLNWNEVRW